jgi:TonB-dependent SusC/RagA subfamily outer membrane receptor
MRKLLFLLIGLFLSCQVLRAQTRTITGKITDVSGRPVSYSSIKIKDGKGGVTADADGYFILKVTGNTGTLIVSSLGFKDEVIPFPTENTLTVRLTPNSKQMDEVVVTALGIKRSKNSLPYAMQQLTAEEVNKVPGTNVLSNLSGKVAGLQITTSNGLGASNNVILRGLKSLTQTNQALFVIDGVPFDNSNQTTTVNKGVDLGSPASDINPDDIESVSVLKGGAASALYGSRGAQGVILITTKKGRKRIGIGLTVNTSVQVGVPDKSTLPVYQTQYGEGYGSAGYNSNFPNQDGFFYWTPTRTSGGQNVNVVQTDIDQATGPAYDASKLVYNGDAFSPSDPNYGKATPWVASKHYKPTDFFETPVTSIFSAFMEGGGDKATFKLGFTNNNDKGLMPNSSALKNQLNFGATYAATDRVTVGGNINYVGETGIGRNYYVYSGAGGGPMNDFRQFWATNIDLHALKHDYFASKANETWNWNGGYVTNTAGNLVAPAYHNNTYFAAYENYNNDSRNRFFGNAHLDYKITDNLNMLARVSQDRYDQLVEMHTAVGSATTASYFRAVMSDSRTSHI